MNITREELDAMCRIAEEAGSAIMEVYECECTAELKEDESPLTIADLRADAVIRARLSGAFPGVYILSEESRSEVQDNTDPQTFFLVDPLDGTKEFLKRNGEFTVNIALIHRGRTIAGVVYVPATGALYHAAAGLGAWRHEEGVTVALKVAPRQVDQPLRVIGSRSHAAPEQSAWLAALACHYTFVAAGSSLKFCRVAEGSADIYPRLAPTCQWDTAAAQCILEMAGGHVVDEHLRPLTYGVSKAMINPYFFATSDTELIMQEARAGS